MRRAGSRDERADDETRRARRGARSEVAVDAIASIVGVTRSRTGCARRSEALLTWRLARPARRVLHEQQDRFVRRAPHTSARPTAACAVSPSPRCPPSRHARRSSFRPRARFRWPRAFLGRFRVRDGAPPPAAVPTAHPRRRVPPPRPRAWTTVRTTTRETRRPTSRHPRGRQTESSRFRLRPRGSPTSASCCAAPGPRERRRHRARDEQLRHHGSARGGARARGRLRRLSTR